MAIVICEYPEGKFEPIWYEDEPTLSGSWDSLEAAYSAAEWYERLPGSHYHWPEDPNETENPISQALQKLNDILVQRGAQYTESVNSDRFFSGTPIPNSRFFPGTPIPKNPISQALKMLNDVLVQRGAQYTESVNSDRFSTFRVQAAAMETNDFQSFRGMIALKMERERTSRIRGSKESRMDSILDLAGYAVLWLAYELENSSDA